MPRRFRREADNPSSTEDEDKRSEDFDTEDSVLDALEEKVLPEGKRKKKSIVSNPPGGETAESTGGPSYPPGAIVPPAEGGPSTPPEGGVAQHETAEPYRPDIALQGLSEHPAVAEQVNYALQQGANPQQARELGYKREQEMQRMEQSGMAPQNINQIAHKTAEHPDFSHGPHEDEAHAEAEAQGEVAPCPMCGGPGVSLGALGRRIHYRCRNCGMDFSQETPQANPLGDVLSHYDHGFVSRARIEEVKKLLS